MLPHPPYSPDLGASDYHHFGPMKKMLGGGQKFASYTEVQSVVWQWLEQQPASFFASGIQKPVDRWDKQTWTIIEEWNAGVITLIFIKT